MVGLVAAAMFQLKTGRIRSCDLRSAKEFPVTDRAVPARVSPTVCRLRTKCSAQPL